MQEEKEPGPKPRLSAGRKRRSRKRHPDIGSGQHQPFDAIAGIGIRVAVSPACHAGPRHVSPTRNTRPGGGSSYGRCAASLPRLRPRLLSLRIGCGGGDRTHDLRLMKPTSFRCSTHAVIHAARASAGDNSKRTMADSPVFSSSAMNRSRQPSTAASASKWGSNSGRSAGGRTMKVLRKILIMLLPLPEQSAGRSVACRGGLEP